MKPQGTKGLVIATVVDAADPTNQGKVKLSFPWLDENVTSDWCPVVQPFAGDDRGIFFMPEIGDEVLAGFLHDDFNHPFVLGAMWNGVSTAPSPDYRQRMIRSKNGHTIRFVDSTPASGNMGALIVEDAHGNRVVMTNGVMRIQAQTVLMIEAQAIVLQGPNASWHRTVTPNNNPI
jgi:uncharacterized protein involved in type VI secretion and phage assembly